MECIQRVMVHGETLCDCMERTGANTELINYS